MYSDMLLRNRRSSSGLRDIIRAFVLSSSKLILQLLLVAFFMMSCDKEHKTIVAPDEDNFPGAPIQIQAMVDDGRIVLVWDMTSTKNVRCYHIYRKDSVQAKMQLTDSTFTRQFIDSNVKNSNIYYYQISALNNKGYEGKRSPVISATPNLFAIIIENGEEYTNKTTVTLSLTAPLGTMYMSIANDSLFKNSTWEIYTSRKTWQLSPGDGEKHVFVKFRDHNGNNTPSQLFDKIILDTKATISEVSENTNGMTKVPGQVIHFKLISGETDGEATVDIGDGVRGIKLYDDGTNGDVKANNGTYEVDYTIPSGFKVMSAIVTGHFKDRVNNQAQDVTASGRVTIQQDPFAVTLYPPAVTGTSTKSLELYWSPGTDDDFASYRMYRKTSPGVDTSAAATLVTTIRNKETTNYTDQDVKEKTNYYYRVFIFNKFGSAKGSNEVMGKIDPDSEKPSPVILFLPIAIENSLTSLTLTWTKNEDENFESYRIHRAKAPNNVDSTSYVVEIIYDQTTTKFEDTGLTENTEYNYQVFVYNKKGKFAGSNKEKCKTNANEPPLPVTLLTPSPIGNSTTSLNLNWSKNVDTDFASYRIYRTKAPQQVDSSSFLVDMIYDQNKISYEDKNLLEGTEYNYRIYVFDAGGKSAGSNTASGTTNANEPPLPVTLLTPSPVGDSYTSLYLSWTKNADTDFGSYRIFRSNAPQGVDSSSFLVHITYDQNTTNFEDKELKENASYNYRVYVFDVGGKSVGSNTATGKTNANVAPTPVIVVQPVVMDSTTLRLNWSQNSDEDFDYYTIYRSESSPVDTSSAPIAIINNRTSSEYYDTKLVKDKTYYYRIFVTDEGGMSSGSNEVSGTPKP